jgi:K+-sensing histidine kinase KdpD
VKRTKGVNSALLIIGAIFGLFAGLMAFIITYHEYLRHFTERRTPVKMALEAAAFAFFVFLTLAIVAGFVLTRAYMRQ